MSSVTTHNLKVGDKVEVLIDVREDKSGQLVLSHKKLEQSKHGIELLQLTSLEKSLMVSLNAELKVV